MDDDICISWVDLTCQNPPFNMVAMSDLPAFENHAANQSAQDPNAHSG